MCVCVNVCACARMWARGRAIVYMRVHVCMCMHVWAHMCVYVCVRTCARGPRVGAHVTCVQGYRVTGKTHVTCVQMPEALCCWATIRVHRKQRCFMPVWPTEACAWVRLRSIAPVLWSCTVRIWRGSNSCEHQGCCAAVYMLGCARVSTRDMLCSRVHVGMRSREHQGYAVQPCTCLRCVRVSTRDMLCSRVHVGMRACAGAPQQRPHAFEASERAYMRKAHAQSTCMDHSSTHPWNKHPCTHGSHTHTLMTHTPIHS